MIIQALNEEFRVIHVRQIQQGEEILRCCTLDGKRDYTVLRFAGEERVRTLLPLFYALQENTAFEDYQGCFTRDGALYVVFYRRKGILLTEMLSEETLDLERRFTLGKRILEKVLLWMLPDFLVCLMLEPDRILVENGEIAFSYEWDIRGEDRKDMAEVNRRVAGLLRRLFSYEVENAVTPALVKLIVDLEQNVPGDFFGIYEAYTGLDEVISLEAKEYQSGILRMKSRFWRGVRRMVSVCKVLLLIVLYAGAVLLLVKEIKSREEEGEEEQGIVFEYIGTLEIEQ